LTYQRNRNTKRINKMTELKDTLITIFNEYVKNTDVETRKELYLQDWNGYYTTKATNDLPEDVKELIDTLLREGELNDMEVNNEILHDYATQDLIDEGIDPENATDEEWESAYEYNIFSETGHYAYSNYVENVVEEKLLEMMKEAREEEVEVIINELRSIFTKQGIILERKTEKYRNYTWKADFTEIVSVDEEWTITIHNYDDETTPIDFEIDYNGHSDCGDELEEVLDIMEYVKESNKKDFVY